MNLGIILAALGLGLMVGLSGTGSAIGLVIGGSSAIGAVRRKPDVFGNALVISALPSTQGLYGFVSFFLFQSKVSLDMGVFEGAMVLAAGISIGLAALFSAIQQGKICASGISAMGSGHDVFGKTFILAVFPEFYAILALVACILINGSI